MEEKMRDTDPVKREPVVNETYVCGCMCAILNRLPWENARHVCLDERGYVTDADFHGQNSPPMCP